MCLGMQGNTLRETEKCKPQTVKVLQKRKFQPDFAALRQETENTAVSRGFNIQESVSLRLRFALQQLHPA